MQYFSIKMRSLFHIRKVVLMDIINEVTLFDQDIGI